MYINTIMMWYGKNINSISLTSTKNIAKRRRFTIKKNSIFRSKFKKTHLSVFFFYFPSLWDSILFKPKDNFSVKKISLIFMYSASYFFIFPICSFYNKIYFDQHTSCYFFKDFYRNTFFLTFWKNFQKIFYSFTSIFFKKLKFKGKGYYIYKNKRNTIAMRFGYSHVKRIFFFFTFVKFLSKTSIIIFGISNFYIDKAANKLVRIRPINIFTSKGMRFTRQIIYKKQGKVSSYR
uniref:Ribosomal protein L6 n=1 Tax=Stylonychia lemnae TaxID=5949 RepID=A0A3S6K9M3_STYLE|nr:ribosomal protein L6 [Stylonychia lemnae]